MWTRRTSSLGGWIVILAAASVAAGSAWGEQADVPQPVLSEGVVAVLERKIDLLRHTLTIDPVVIQAAKDAPMKEASLADILSLDRKWVGKSQEVEELVKGVLTSECAKHLVAFQDGHEEFSEIFATDARGLVVGETNRTSDYYQADEDWWVKGYAGGRGETFYGSIEYDESAMVESIPIYVPIVDPDTQRAVGVIKAVIDLTAVKREL